MSSSPATLPLYALAALSPAETADLEAALSQQPAWQEDLDAYRATAAELIALIPPLAPSAQLRSRLLTSIGAGRFEAFTPAFAALFDVAVERARELLSWIDNPARWMPVLPHFSAIHFAGGPACVGADTGFVRMSPGGLFPYHAHLGEERALILAGIALTSDGIQVSAGDEIVGVPGTAHDFVNISKEDLIYASRAFGVQFGLVKPA